MKFKKWDCAVELGQYSNGRLAISLVSAHSDEDLDIYQGEPIATATVNVPEITVNASQVIIKDYSENEGILKFLQDNGFVSEKTKTHSLGFVEVHVAEKTAKLLEMEAVKFGTDNSVQKKRKIH